MFATIVVVALGLALGQWQTRRALGKEAIEARLIMREAMPPIVIGPSAVDIDAIEYRPVMMTGEFVRDWPVYLDNRPYQGRAGLYVLMPFKIAGSDLHVLVARGWIARNPIDRARLPVIATPPGTVEIRGVVRRRTGRLFQFGAAQQLHAASIVQNVEIADLAAASGLKMQPFIIEQLNDKPGSGAAGKIEDGLVRDWPRASSGADRNRGYAFQWYGLAAMAFIFFVVTGFRRGTN